MCRRGLELLASDADTEVIVAISKPPDPAVAQEIVDVAAGIGKPVVLAFLGLSDLPQPPAGVEYARTLELRRSWPRTTPARRCPCSTRPPLARAGTSAASTAAARCATRRW